MSKHRLQKSAQTWVLTNAPSWAPNNWYLGVHSGKMDLDLTKMGIFESWLVTGKDSRFETSASAWAVYQNPWDEILASIKTGDSTCKGGW